MATNLSTRLSRFLRRLESTTWLASGGPSSYLLTEDEADRWSAGLEQLEEAAKALELGRWSDAFDLMDACPSLAALIDFGDWNELSAISAAVLEKADEQEADDAGLSFAAPQVSL